MPDRPRHIMYYQTFNRKRGGKDWYVMKVVSNSPSMIMGCRSYTAKNGVTYFSADVYDLEAGNMFRCELTQDIFNQLNNVQKPATVKSLMLDIGNQYQGRSRISILGWQ